MIPCQKGKPQQINARHLAGPQPRPTSATGLDMLDGEAPGASWSVPLPKDILTIKLLDEELDTAALGVATAFLVLLENCALPGWLPAAIDEQRTPLSWLMAPIPSFCFAENHGPPIHVVRRSNAAHQPSPKARRQPAHGFPRRHARLQASLCKPQMHQYVSLLVERFRMSVGELVMAYACVERVLILHPTTLRASSIRPMLLGASIVACKTSRDGRLCLWQVPMPTSPSSAPQLASFHLHGPHTQPLTFDLMQPSRSAPAQFCYVLHDVLDVDVPLLACIEGQMLELLDWSVPMALGLHQTYADAIFEAASRELRRHVAAPQVVLAFEEPRAAM